MNFAIRLETAVVKTLDRVDRPTEKRLRNRIDALAADPFDSRLSEPLTGKGDLRKSRVGGWRIVFEVDVRASWIAVVAWRRRGQVYKNHHVYECTSQRAPRPLPASRTLPAAFNSARTFLMSWGLAVGS